MVRSLAVVVALLGVACGGDDDKPAPSSEPVCEAGRLVECPCEGGTTATQECKADGSAWGACGCADPSEVPALACNFPRDQSTLPVGSRCTAKHDMYGECDEAVVVSGACSKTPAGFFCCAQR